MNGEIESKCQHDPVQQVRGEMGKGDYFDVMAADADHAKVERFTYKHPGADYSDHVELDDGNKTDIRIICRKCHLTTGWNKADAPGMPGVGVDFVKRRWVELTK
jgi:hypothetical protein